MATISRLVVSIGADASPFQQGLKTAQSSLRSFGSQLKGVGTGMSLGLTAPLAGVATMAINSAADFETSMNMIEASTGATGAQMQVLQAQALQLGADTSFSAGEAADAMLELAKAGMSTEQIGASIAGVMDLAAAGGIGLADAANITSNAINSFGLDAGAATSVANTFAAAANASSADVSDLAEGFANAGAIFASNGQTVTDLAAALAILSNNGIAGAEAGTQLKVMMTSLAAPTAAAQKAMAQMGLHVFDASGAMVPFGEIVAQLETGLAGMSDAQRNAAMSTIFGTHAINAANILADKGAASFQAMTEAVSRQGAASEMSDAHMKGLGGAIEGLKGNIESLLIGAAMPFMDTLSGMVRRAAEFVSGLGNLSPETQRFMAILLGVVAVAGPLLVLLGTMATAIAGLLSPVGLVIAAVGLLGVGFATNFGGMRDAVVGAWGVIQPYLAQAYAWFVGVLPGALAAVQGWFTTAWTAASGAVGAAWGVIAPYLAQAWAWLQAALPGALATVQAWFASAWTTAAGAVGVAWGVIAPLLAQAWAWLQAVLPGALAGLGGFFATAWTAASTAVSTAWAVVAPLLAQAWAWLQAVLPGAVAGLGGAFSTAWTAVSTAVSAAWAVVGPLLAQAWAWLQAVLPGAVSGLGGAFSTAWTAVSTAVSTAWGVIAPLLTQAFAWLQAVLPGAVSGLGGAFSTGWSAASTAVSTAWGAMQGVFASLSGQLSASLPGALAGLQGSFAGAWAAIQSGWAMVEGIFAPAIARVQAAFAGLGTGFSGMGTALSNVQGAFASLGTALGQLWGAVQPLVQQLAGLLAGTLGVVALGAVNGFAAALQQIGPVLTTLVNQVAVTVGFVATVISGLVAGIQALINGDWAGAWAAAGSIVDGFKTFVSSTFGNLLQLVAAIWQVISNTVTSTLSDLGVSASGIMDGIKSWWQEKWNALVGFVQPVIDIIGSVKDTLDGFASWLSSLSIPNPFAGILDTLNSLRDKLPGWMPGSTQGTATSTPGQAQGTSYWRGGLTWVGEQGPELVNLPRGAQVWSHDDSLALAGAGSGTTVSLGPVYVQDRLDAEALAYRVATIIARKRKRRAI